VVTQIFLLSRDLKNIMPKNKSQKNEIFRNLIDKVSKAKSLIFVGYDALGVKDNEALRLKLKSENSEYYVPKKTLMNMALKENKIEANIKDYAGKVAAVFSYEDEVASAKILGAFRKDKEKENKITFLGGILDGRLLSKEDVEALSLLPSKPELYAKMVGSINAPISGFVNVLAGNLRGLVGVLKAIESKK